MRLKDYCSVACQTEDWKVSFMFILSESVGFVYMPVFLAVPQIGMWKEYLLAL
jgi:hypothetical protein